MTVTQSPQLAFYSYIYLDSNCVLYCLTQLHPHELNKKIVASNDNCDIKFDDLFDSVPYSRSLLRFEECHGRYFLQTDLVITLWDCMHAPPIHVWHMLNFVPQQWDVLYFLWDSQRMLSVWNVTGSEIRPFVDLIKESVSKYRFHISAFFLHIPARPSRSEVSCLCTPGTVG